MNIMLVAALLAGTAVVTDVRKTPAEAVALANARVGHKTKGVFQMTVAAAGRLGKTVFLNSLLDYRAPDDLTFELTGSAAKALEKQLAAKPEVALLLVGP